MRQQVHEFHRDNPGVAEDKVKWVMPSSWWDEVRGIKFFRGISSEILSFADGFSWAMLFGIKIAVITDDDGLPRLEKEEMIECP